MDQVAQLRGFGLFDARVPRYTSYPAAPHFSPAVGPQDFAGWVAAIPAGAALSVYLHVPFCRRLCWFCACRTQGTRSDDPVRSYAEVLLAEIAMLGKLLAPGVTLSRLHWGGGTPTLLPPDLIRDIAAAIFAVIPMGSDAEFSVEIDPNEVDDARMDALAGAGMNRASIGVQDFDPVIQKAIGRDQSYEVTLATVQMLRARGIGSVNADILYGLPHQTRARMADSVQKLLSLSPDRVALYGYAHVPWMARRQVMIDPGALPSPEQRLDLFATAERLFLAEGYQPIGIDHFAKPGDGMARAARAGQLRRNFQGYTDDAAGALIGLGASAISRLPQGFAQNASRTSDHVRAVRAGGFSTHRGHRLAGEDRLRARMIEALMCDFAIGRAEMEALAPAARVADLLSGAAERFPGMVSLSADGLAIPPAARPLTRMIARAFDAYDMTASAHSQAV